MLTCDIPGWLPRAALAAAQREEMFALLAEHFDGVTAEQFERDLAEKNWVITLRRAGRLVGFSTLLVTAADFEDRPLLAVYSGDTIVAPDAWGTPALARAWIAGVNRLRQDYPGLPCYWLLLSSGFRTYRLLPVFWREFFPCYTAPTPARAQRLLNHLADLRYGPSFDPGAGLVRFRQPQRLRGALAAIPSGRDTDAHVAFFLARNPGYRRGDELVCLTEIVEANLTAAGRRMVAACPV